MKLETTLIIFTIVRMFGLFLLTNFLAGKCKQRLGQNVLTVDTPAGAPPAASSSKPLSHTFGGAQLFTEVGLKNSLAELPQFCRELAIKDNITIAKTLQEIKTRDELELAWASVVHEKLKLSLSDGLDLAQLAPKAAKVGKMLFSQVMETYGSAGMQLALKSGLPTNWFWEGLEKSGITDCETALKIFESSLQEKNAASRLIEFVSKIPDRLEKSDMVLNEVFNRLNRLSLPIGDKLTMVKRLIKHPERLAFQVSNETSDYQRSILMNEVILQMTSHSIDATKLMAQIGKQNVADSAFSIPVDSLIERKIFEDREAVKTFAWAMSLPPSILSDITLRSTIKQTPLKESAEMLQQVCNTSRPELVQYALSIISGHLNDSHFPVSEKAKLSDYIINNRASLCRVAAVSVIDEVQKGLNK